MGAGSLITLGGSGVGSWPHGMILLSSSIFELLTVLNHLLRRFQNVSEFPQLCKALSHVRCLSPAGCWRDARRVLGFVDPDMDTLTDDVSFGGKIKDFVYLYNFQMFACIGFH